MKLLRFIRELFTESQNARQGLMKIKVAIVVFCTGVIVYAIVLDLLAKE